MATNIIKIDGGFLTWREGGGGTIEIFDIHVDNEVRRTGKGRDLLEALFHQVGPTTPVFAITRIDNEIAQQFYEKCRFEVVGVLRRFYGGVGADAVMYGRLAGGPV